MNLEGLPLAIAIGSLAAAVVAGWIAWIAIRRSDLNASAVMIVTLNQSFSQGFRLFISAENEGAKVFEFGELLNTLEIAAAVHQEGTIRGVSRKLLEQYLCRVLSIFAANEDTRARIGLLRDAPSTFEQLSKFLIAMKRQGKTDFIDALANLTPRA